MKKMDLDSYLTPDQKELIELLNQAEVDYMLIGAIAVAYHGYPRDSLDLDIFCNPDKNNIEKLFETLNDFFHDGFHTDATYDDIAEGTVIRFGVGNQRTELLPKIDGVDFSEAKENMEKITLKDGTVLPFIGYESLIKNKSSTGRLKDQADVEELKKVNSENNDRSATSD